MASGKHFHPRGSSPTRNCPPTRACHPPPRSPCQSAQWQGQSHSTSDCYDQLCLSHDDSPLEIRYGCCPLHRCKIIWVPRGPSPRLVGRRVADLPTAVAGDKVLEPWDHNQEPCPRGRGRDRSFLVSADRVHAVEDRKPLAAVRKAVGLPSAVAGDRVMGRWDHNREACPPGRGRDRSFLVSADRVHAVEVRKPLAAVCKAVGLPSAAAGDRALPMHIHGPWVRLAVHK